MFTLLRFSLLSLLLFREGVTILTYEAESLSRIYKNDLEHINISGSFGRMIIDNFYSKDRSSTIKIIKELICNATKKRLQRYSKR